MSKVGNYETRAFSENSCFQDRSGTSGSLGSWSKEDIQEHGAVMLLMATRNPANSPVEVGS